MWVCYCITFSLYTVCTRTRTHTTLNCKLNRKLTRKLTRTPCIQARVLHMAQSPDGTTIVSAAADETLRFWRILGSPTRSAAKLKMEHSSRALLGANCIR